MKTGSLNLVSNPTLRVPIVDLRNGANWFELYSVTIKMLKEDPTW